MAPSAAAVMSEVAGAGECLEIHHGIAVVVRYDGDKDMAASELTGPPVFRQTAFAKQILGCESAVGPAAVAEGVVVLCVVQRRVAGTGADNVLRS